MRWLTMGVLILTLSPSLSWADLQPTVPGSFVRGTLTDAETGVPIAAAKIRLRRGAVVAATAATDSEGNFRVAVPPGAYELRFKQGKSILVRVFDVVPGKVAVVNGRMRQSEGEVIIVRERQRERKAQAVNYNPHKVPAYSDKAITANQWARAWLVLDVDTKGVVARAKFMHRPGYGLDEIALKQVFGLKFEPSINKQGAKIRTLVVWSIDWPAYWWLIDNHGTATGMLRRETPHFTREQNPQVWQRPEARTSKTENRDSPSAATNRRGFGQGDRTILSAEPFMSAPTTLEDKVPCRNKAALHFESVSQAVRDCTPPPMDKPWDSEPWIYPKGSLARRKH